MANTIGQANPSGLPSRGNHRRLLARSSLWCLAVLLPSLGSSSSARAGGLDEKERAAKKACLSGDYVKGVSLLTDLYVDTNDANHIFNQGRCYEQGNRCEEAIISFREYLRKTKDAGKLSDGRAEQHITDCQELLRKAKAETAPPPASGNVAPMPLLPHPEPTASGQDVGVQRSLTSAPPGRGLRVAGAVTFGLGVAAVAAGVGFAMAANQLADELETSPSSYDRGKESTRSSYATLSTVGYATGAACAATGVLLYVLGWRQGSAASASVQPMVGDQSAGALVKVVF
jgi:hypothetical protein